MKKRLDALCMELGLFESREKARASIMAGEVFVAGERADKAGLAVADGTPVEYRGEKLRYVSRGGLKLEKAIEVFPVELAGKICADIGASTGGFTDCMLQNGAAKVYAVDVGYGQLAWKLRSDPRVVCIERTNARYLTAQQIPQPLDFFSVDVSFISLRHILPAVTPLLSEDGSCVCLIKPQFEAGRESVGKRGVVRDSAVHRSVIEKACGYAGDCGLKVAGLDFSPVTGPNGNIEFLAYFSRNSAAPTDVAAVVAHAHELLKVGD